MAERLGGRRLFLQHSENGKEPGEPFEVHPEKLPKTAPIPQAGVSHDIHGQGTERPEAYRIQHGEEHAVIYLDTKGQINLEYPETKQSLGQFYNPINGNTFPIGKHNYKFIIVQPGEKVPHGTQGDGQTTETNEQKILRLGKIFKQIDYMPMNKWPAAIQALREANNSKDFLIQAIRQHGPANENAKRLLISAVTALKK